MVASPSPCSSAQDTFRGLDHSFGAAGKLHWINSTQYIFCQADSTCETSVGQGTQAHGNIVAMFLTDKT